MQYLDLFPTPLFVDFQKDLAKKILPVAEEYISKFGKPFRGNINYISTYNIDAATVSQRGDQRFFELSYYLHQSAKQYFNDHKVDPARWKFNPYYLFNKSTDGGEHQNHAHPDCILSGVFYLKVPENSSPIIFQDPRDYYKFVSYPPIFGDTSEKYKLLSEYVINPQEGMILMWPSWLEHAVPKSKISEERIAVAFNLV